MSSVGRRRGASRLARGPISSSWKATRRATSSSCSRPRPCGCAARPSHASEAAGGKRRANVARSVTGPAALLRVPPAARRRALDALAGVFDADFARVRTREHVARAVGAVGRVAHDRYERFALLDLVLVVVVLLFLQDAAAAGEPADEREAADDRERAHGDGEWVLADLFTPEHDVANDEDRAEHRAGERGLRAVRARDLASLPHIVVDDADAVGRHARALQLLHGPAR